MRCFVVSLSLFMLLLLAAPVSALVYQFNGSISEVQSGSAPVPLGLAAAIPLGTPIRIEYSFDPNAPNTDRDPNRVGEYAVDRIELTIGTRSFTVLGTGQPGEPRIRTLPGGPGPLPGFFGAATYGLEATDLAPLGSFGDRYGISDLGAGVRLVGQMFPAPMLFTTEILGLPMASFNIGFLNGEPFAPGTIPVGVRGFGTFTAVPEPGVALMFGLGLAALSFRRLGA